MFHLQMVHSMEIWVWTFLLNILSVHYNAIVFVFSIGGIGIGKAVEGCEDQFVSINLPLFQITVPPTLAGYKRTLPDQTTCPQKRGGIYTLDIPFRFVTTAVTTFVRITKYLR